MRHVILLYVEQLNVRNVDGQLWEEVKRSADESGITVGAMLNRILADWTANTRVGPKDRRTMAASGRGILRHLSPGVVFTDELRRMRDAEAEAER